MTDAVRRLLLDAIIGGGQTQAVVPNDLKSRIASQILGDPAMASITPTKGIFDNLQYARLPKEQQKYRGMILPFEKNLDTGDVSPAVPGAVTGLLNGAYDAYSAPYRAMTGQLPMTDASGNVSPQAIAESTNMAGMLTMGSGALPASANEMRMGVKLLHASPHEFDRFERSPATRLSGEGNATFGDGLYFAENPETANSYARQFADSHGQAIKYHVDLNAEPEHILDLEKPLSQQPKELRDKVIAALPQQISPLDYLLNWDGSMAKEIEKKHYDAMAKLTGGEAYKLLEQTLGTQEKASNALQQAGVPAMRYLDAGSRDAGKGTHNYIVVDPSKANILSKEKFAPVPDPEWLRGLKNGTGA